MDWKTLYCPNKYCKYYAIPFQQGKMVKNGTDHGQPQALCKSCRSSVTLNYGMAYYGLESDPLIFETAVRALAEGNSLRATGRILQIDQDTVCDWLNRAASHCRAVVLYLWSQLKAQARFYLVGRSPSSQMRDTTEFSRSGIFSFMPLVP